MTVSRRSNLLKVLNNEDKEKGGGGERGEEAEPLHDSVKRCLVSCNSCPGVYTNKAANIIIHCSCPHHHHGGDASCVAIAAIDEAARSEK